MTNFPNDNYQPIESDLTTLYSAPVPVLRFDPSPSQTAIAPRPGWTRFLGRHWRPAMAGAAVITALAVAFTVVSLRGGETQSVSAAEVFERANASAQTAAPADGSLTYHMISTGGKLGAGAGFTSETWYGGEGRYRTENRLPDGPSFGQVVNGDDVWIYSTFDGVTHAAHGPASVLGKGFAVESVTGQQSLPDVLRQYSGDCQSAEQTGEDILAGRRTYVITVTTDSNQCPSGVDDMKARVLEGSSLMLWVDQQTFLTLQTEHREPDGSVSFRQATSELTISPEMPASLFTFQASDSVQVVEATDIGQVKAAIAPVSRSAPDGSQKCASPQEEGAEPRPNHC